MPGRQGASSRVNDNYFSLVTFNCRWLVRPNSAETLVATLPLFCQFWTAPRLKDDRLAEE